MNLNLLRSCLDLRNSIRINLFATVSSPRIVFIAGGDIGEILNHLWRRLPRFQRQVGLFGSQGHPLMKFNFLIGFIHAAGDLFGNLLHFFITSVFPRGSFREINIVYITAGAIGKDADERR